MSTASVQATSPATGTPEARPPQRCGRCGKLSPHAIFSHRQNKGSEITYCTPCWHRQQWRNLWIGLGTLGLLVLAFWLIFPDSHGGFLWGGLNLLLLFALSPPLVVLHELGHALAGWAVRMRVFRVILGSGRVRWHFKFGGTRFVLGSSLPDSGVTLGALPDLRLPRVRLFLFTLGGPLVNALLLLAVVGWYSPGELRRGLENLTSEVHVPAVFAAANGLFLVMSLLPMKHKHEGVPLASDGLNLLTMPFMKEEAVREAHAGYFLLSGSEAELDGDAAGARAWFERGLSVFPNHPSHRLMLASNLIGCKEFTLAREIDLELLQRQDLPAELRPAALDGVATADLLLLVHETPVWQEHGPDAEEFVAVDLAEEGIRLSNEAAKLLDDSPRQKASLLGTLGSLLVQQGRLEEGAAILLEVLDELQTPGEQAYCACFLALAEARQGEPEKAAAWLAKARQWHAENPAIEAIARSLEELAASTATLASQT